jgi:hypothetical protein
VLGGHPARGSDAVQHALPGLGQALAEHHPASGGASMAPRGTGVPFLQVKLLGEGLVYLGKQLASRPARKPLQSAADLGRKLLKFSPELLKLSAEINTVGLYPL